MQRKPIFSQYHPNQHTHIRAVVKAYICSFFHSYESTDEFAFVEALIVANSVTIPYSDIECIECSNICSFFHSYESTDEFAFVEALIVANSVTIPYSDIECIECSNSIAVKSTIENALI